MRPFMWVSVVAAVWAIGCSVEAPGLEQAQDALDTGGRSVATSPPPDSENVVDAPDPVDTDVVAYAEKCKEELGITEPLPDLSCTDGQRDRTATSWDASRHREVPITIDNRLVDDSTYAQALNQGCDRSQWLEERCWTYDLIQRVAIKPDVEAILNCRQKYPTNARGVADRKAAYLAATGADKLAKFKLIYEFDDLGYILRNKNSGKTCFFTSFGVQYYGGWIPAPDRRTIPSREEIYAMLPDPKPPANYDERQWNRGPRGHHDLPQNMFFSPKATANGGCVGCHTQGAFKHSPFIDQVSTPEIGRIVPSNDRLTPYLLVGGAFQRAFRDFGVTEVDTGNGGENTCVGCHRMNAGSENAALIAGWAVGINPPAMSTWATQWPQRAWMKPNHRKTSEAAYREAFGHDVDKMLCCMRNPDAKGCLKRAVGPTTTEAALAADGTLDDKAWVRGQASESCEL